MSRRCGPTCGPPLAGGRSRPPTRNALRVFCVVAAWFEQVYRSRRLWPGTPLSDADETVTLDRLLAAVPT